MRQDIHYCRSADATRIAYATAGDGPPLLEAANWLAHLELDWQNPQRAVLLHALARRYRLVRYDLRGTGLSERTLADLGPEPWADDLAAVADAAGLKRFAILALSQAGATAIRYAVRHPERVSHLILLGAYARGPAKRSATDAESAATMGRLIREGWGSDHSAYRRRFAAMYLPDGRPEDLQADREVERASAAPETAERIWSRSARSTCRACFRR
jgi:pimeloyl-ACP methyl ester carboxylesterase